MITKTEKKKIERKVSLLHAAVIIIVSIVNGSAIFVGFCLPGYVGLVMGGIAVALTQFIAKEFSRIHHRKKIFYAIALVAKDKDFLPLIPTLADNYEKVIDKILMRGVFYMLDKKKEYKTLKLKIKLYRKSLDKNK